MTTTAIAPGLVLHTTSIAEHCDNGKLGDERVALCTGERVDGGLEPFLRTNAGPTPIATWALNDVELGSTPHTCSLESAAEALGVPRLEFARRLLGIGPDWDVTASAFVE